MRHVYQKAKAFSKAAGGWVVGCFDSAHFVLGQNESHSQKSKVPNPTKNTMNDPKVVSNQPRKEKVIIATTPSTMGQIGPSVCGKKGGMRN